MLVSALPGELPGRRSSAWRFAIAPARLVRADGQSFRIRTILTGLEAGISLRLIWDLEQDG